MSDDLARFFVPGFVLGGALWMVAIGTALIRRGEFRPLFWGGPHLARRPQLQGRGFVTGAVVFGAVGVGYAFFPLLGTAILVVGLTALLLVGRRLERRARLEDLEQEQARSERAGPS